MMETLGEVVDSLTTKRKPLPHQRDALKYGLVHDRFLLLDQMGLGKTKEAVDLALLHRELDGVKHVLIIAGVSALRSNWKREIELDTDLSSMVLGERIMKNGTYRLGQNPERKEDIFDFLKNPDSAPFFIITNLPSLLDKDVIAGLQELTRDGQIGMIVFDECHKCKNPQAKASKALLTLSAPYMLAMSGTILPNKILDLWMPLRWLGFESHNFYAFRNHYCVMSGMFNQIVEYRHVDEIHRILQEHMLRRLTKDVVHLPPLSYELQYLDMDDSQSRIYNQVLADVRAQLDNIDFRLNAQNQLLRLRQATTCPSLLSSSDIHNAKFERILDIAREYDGKIIVFTEWAKVAHALGTFLTRHNARNWVSTGFDSDWDINIRGWKESPTGGVLIGTVGKIGTGLTLNEATLVIFLDEPWTRADKQQAIDRCYRIGQDKKVHVITLLCADTIDERVHAVLKGKGELSDWVVDNKKGESFRDSL